MTRRLPCAGESPRCARRRSAHAGDDSSKHGVDCGRGFCAAPMRQNVAPWTRARMRRSGPHLVNGVEIRCQAPGPEIERHHVGHAAAGASSSCAAPGTAAAHRPGPAWSSAPFSRCPRLHMCSLLDAAYPDRAAGRVIRPGRRCLQLHHGGPTCFECPLFGVQKIRAKMACSVDVVKASIINQ